jgi:chitin synthase
VDGEKGAVVEDIEKTAEDLESQFKETVQRAVAKFVPPEEKAEMNIDVSVLKTIFITVSICFREPQDSNRTFRTRLVLVWMITNAALAVAIENVNGLNTTVADQNQKQYVSLFLAKGFG